MSMTDYASLIDESNNANELDMKMPESIKPMGLLEHSKRKKDGKPVRPLKGIRNSRLDEIRGGIAAANGFKTNKNDASRTL